jgi:hypothetical protein
MQHLQIGIFFHGRFGNGVTFRPSSLLTISTLMPHATPVSMTLRLWPPSGYTLTARRLDSYV